ncbi:MULTISPECIES: ATP-grasp domain-containing protein [unclassified Pseudoalteromonas]|uniref:ATP-grasp domain-containing protein n=1 Tax=unclassified Pseudoalteromonas TaxID=194690 RepID=UPI000C7DD86E|nr:MULTISPECIES: RimK family alpha-L-glutamate ligase [unclassified Pseudoalteromonas]AUJ69631.1 Ribosomal protein S6 modification protein [Pseudoalteromonas sp. NC201]MCF2827570.1 RimK family alpha-L-glutamate ligase [Pseudoalteromonas sp. OF5H-5]MCF2830124.1 RimK family alpha-L-glutamate ligase [Pseudoalteromonas sp. DL2-H6]MCF2927217.1 RimK family alpha-L-glutamate ligase [Pseudoalteromonas sp. DL2-H1]MCF7516015.1 RimK family alpha-L-glutamate ligase [Pseudoalteromonas sp. L7]
MRGWIIYKDSASLLKPEIYEIDRLMAVAKEEGIDLQVYSPDQFDLLVTREDEESILIDGQPVALPDFVLPRMGAGTTYFTLAIIRHLERLGVHCFNSSQSIETVKDKLYAQQILAEQNLPTPKTMLVKFPVNIELVEKQIGFPVVIKTLSGSQGSGVFLSKSRGEFDDLMQLIEATNPKANIILQRFVKSSHGRDLRVLTIGGRAVACMERNSGGKNFKANVSLGAKGSPHPITPEIEWLATQTANILNLDVAGIDLLFDEEHFKICEANSSPGFEGLEQAVDIDVAREILHFIRIRLGIFNRTGQPKKSSNGTKASKEKAAE